MSRDPQLYLEDIAEAASAVSRYVQGVSRDELEANDEKQAALERQLFIIGEAVAQFPAEVTSRRPDIPWRRIVGLRNILAHGYWRIDLDELWDVVTTKVCPLSEAVRELLRVQS